MNQSVLNVLLILGHPRLESLCGALADAYREGASDASVEIRELVLADLEFDPDVHTVDPSDQLLEPDLVRAQAELEWADHIVIVYPNWWSTMPALMKGFFDRVLEPGWAFKKSEDVEGPGHEELLGGRTAELLVTMDMPSWVYRWIYRKPGINALKRGTLGYVGIRTTRVTTFGPVNEATEDKREWWLERARELGSSLETGPDPRLAGIRRRLSIWLSALRLQFYPMAWLAYAVGALAAVGSADVFTAPVFWIGLAFVFFLEAATVLSNEYFDYETDRQNAYAGPFTGGSGVLVNAKLDFEDVRSAFGISLALAAIFGFLAVVLGAGSPIVAAGAVGALAVLALGYTIPPLEFSYRTLGELDVAATHSIGVLLCGFLFLGGDPTDPRPWLLGAPLLLSIVPSITLAGVPDVDADRAVGKETIAVRFGIGGVVEVAATSAVLAAVLASLWQFFDVVPGAYTPAIYLSGLHALLIVLLVRTRVAELEGPDRVDLTMVVALSYILWFAVIPLVALL